MGFRTPASKNRREAVVDVGTHAAKAFVFERDASGRVAGSAKKFVSVLPAAADSRRIAARLKKLFSSLDAGPGMRPDTFTVGLASPAASSSVESWDVKRERSGFRISRSELTDLFAGAKASRRKSEPALLAYPLEVLVNGYPVRASMVSESDPGITLMPCEEKQEGPSIVFRVIRMAVLPEIVEQLEDFRIQWKSATINVVPLSRAYQEAFVSVLGISDVLLVDVGGEGTSLMYMKGGAPLWISSFPSGVHRAVRTLASDLGSFADAEDAIRAYTAGMGTNATTSRIREVLEKMSAEWKDGFIAALDAVYQWGPMSGDVLLTGGGAKLPEIGLALRDAEWIRKFSHVRSPTVQILSGGRFFEGHSLGGTLTGSDDAGLAALVCYAIRKR